MCLAIDIWALYLNGIRYEPNDGSINRLLSNWLIDFLSKSILNCLIVHFIFRISSQYRFFELFEFRFFFGIWIWIFILLFFFDLNSFRLFSLFFTFRFIRLSDSFRPCNFFEFSKIDFSRRTKNRKSITC